MRSGWGHQCTPGAVVDRRARLPAARNVSPRHSLYMIWNKGMSQPKLDCYLVMGSSCTDYLTVLISDYCLMITLFQLMPIFDMLV